VQDSKDEPMMTEEEFLKDLKELPSCWTRSSHYNIRFTTPDERELCPITAVYFHKTGEYLPAVDVSIAASRLGLKEYGYIISASDRSRFLPNRLLSLRGRILEAISGN